MRILLLALGSHGDVHPFVGVGLALKNRGHDVTIAANEYFEPLIRGVGLGFEQMGTAALYRELAQNPDLWDKSRSFKVVFEQGVASSIPSQYELVVEHHKRGAIVAASSLALGARIAQDKFDIPLATVHLQPSVLRSIYKNPKLPGLPMPLWLPKPMKRALWWAADALVIDRVVAPHVNRFRAQVGLPPVRKILGEWWNSPRMVIGLFPDWFADPQPDWPKQLRLTGFPLYDESDHTDLPAELLEFLDAGESPIVFTPGSAMWSAQSFLETSAAACKILNRRGVLLTRHRDHLPGKLPRNVIHADYAPFSKLLPRAAALVHHGGIGTSAQALAAGIPQLVTPFTHDQPDNAARLKRLGVAEVLSTRAYRAKRLAAKLSGLLDSTDVAANARNSKKRMQGENPLQRTCELIESLGS